jgi:hypothetical protein
MQDIDLQKTENWLTAKDGRRYIPLGESTASRLSSLAISRIKRETATPQREIWGTLGAWTRGGLKEFSGKISYSTRGNRESNAEESGEETIHLINEVRASRRPDLNTDEYNRVVERYIDLSKVKFPVCPKSFSLNNQPSLRLTVFVQPGEGALVYLDRSRTGDEAPQLILPESTSTDFSCSTRDRLTYRIPLWPEGGIKKATPRKRGGDISLTAKKDSSDYEKKLIIKVLTFGRGNSTSHDVVRHALSALGRDKYSLERWDLTSGKFQPVTTTDVHHDQKTLLMIHGTFSSTKGSFGSLTMPRHESWMQTIAISGQRYQQILAFNHETVLDGLAANEAELNRAMGGKLSKPVDIITHSRGGLLGKHLAIYGRNVQVDRAALCTCANGVGYFNLLNHISWMLTILARVGKYSSIGSIAIVLAQHSVKFIAGLDGFKPMIPGNPELKKVLRTIPQNRKKTLFLPIVGDWDYSLVKNARWYARWGAKGIDILLRAILNDKNHDWVVSSTKQAIVPRGCAVKGFIPKPFVKSLHTRYFNKDEVPVRIKKFLLTGK